MATSLGLKLPRAVQLSAKREAKDGTEATLENKEKGKRSKTTFLNRHIMEYQSIFRDLGVVCEGDS